MAVTINGTTGILAPDIGIDGTTLTVDAVNNRVGIATSSPGTPLDVAGEIQSDTGLKVAGHPLVGYSSITGGYAARLGSTGSTTLNKTQIYARGAHVSTFDGATGNVGIGTETPGALLSLESTAANAARLRIGFDGPRYYDIYRSSTESPSGYLNFYGSQSSFVGYTFGGVDGERLRIDSSGRLLKSGQAELTSTSLSYPIQVAAAADANAIAIIGRAADDIGELAFYEADKTTKLGELQYRQDHLNLRCRVGDIRFASGGTSETLRIDGSGRMAQGGKTPTNHGSPNLLLWGTDPTLHLSATGSTANTSFAGIKFAVAGGSTGDYSKAGIFVQRQDSYNDLDMIFAFRSTNDAAGVAISDEKLRINSDGKVLMGGIASPLAALPGIQMYLGGGDPSLVGCKADNNPGQYVTLLKLAGYSQSSSSFRENAAILFETNTANNSGNASGRILFRTEGLNETNGPSTRAVITAEGKMGIGIESPSGILDIKATQTSSLKTFLRLGDSGNGGSYFDFNMSDQSSGADEINHRKDGYVPKNSYGLKISSHSTLNGSYTGAGPASIRWYYPSAGGGNQAGGQLEFWTNQNGYAGTSEAKRMQIDNYGNIGAPSGNNIYNASDERLKENMVNLTGCLEKVKQLRPISFTWKDGFGMMGGVAEYGFGAQTTQAVDEILVEPFGDDDIILGEETIENPLRVNDKYIVPILVRALQEEIAKREALEQRLIDAGL